MILSFLLLIFLLKIENKESIKKWINEKNDEGFTSLHFAAFKGNLVNLLSYQFFELKKKNYIQAINKENDKSWSRYSYKK